jgi:SpoVK/Ycf46/Vps4 family AAA+-type ATPase
MSTAQDLHDIGLLLRCGTPLIVLETREEQRALVLLRQVLKQHSQKQPGSRALFTWSAVNGLQRQDLSLDASDVHSDDPKRMLEQIRAERQPGIYVLFDFHPWLGDPVLVRLIKEIALAHEHCPRTLVLVSHALDLPAELKRLAARTVLSLPSADDIRSIIAEEARRYSSEHQQARVRTDREVLAKLTRLLSGLTFADVRRLVRSVIYDDGAITESEMAEVNRAKFELLDMDGAVSFEMETAQFADVGGLRVFRDWLQQRALFFTGTPPAGLDAPKGVLLVGVQGGGKSLAAKACAGLLGLPLLRLDVGALYNKYHGESERNLREALALAAAVSPCVLWFDEIEKGMAGGDNDGGTSKRMLGHLLTWLAERRPGIFVVATANAIDELPPELIRKGRFDEIFFVDLPTPSVRADIFAIHLRKRDLPVEHFDLTALALASDGFSGAEIEQAVVAACYRGHAQDRGVDQELLLTALQATQPLSVVMAEQLAALRDWARGRTVSADLESAGP